MEYTSDILELQSNQLFLSSDEREHFEERAAIMEYEGGLSRQEAEQAAFEMIKNYRRVYKQVV